MIRQLPLALSWAQGPRLDDFVVGANQVVLNALRAALEDQGETLIYLTGPPGCGRTHLLLGQCAAADRRGLRCAYLPLADHGSLAPEMLDGLETLALLAIDDVQAIAGDETWEQALFNLFNRAREHGCRLVFSADRGPAALSLELADLRSRLAWGLTLGVAPLDDSGRMALLKSLAQQHTLDLPDPVARFLLARSPRHPRVLADTVEKLNRACLAAKRERVSVDFVKKQLGY